MSSLTKENIPHLCRACLRTLVENENGLSVNQRKQGPAFYHIDRTNNLHKWMTIINPLEDVTRLKNSEHHKQFPQYVCRSCYDNFRHLNDFKEMVVHSFSVLSKLLATDDGKKTTQVAQPVVQSELIVKSEPIDDDNVYNVDDDDDDIDDDDDDDDDNDGFDDDEYMEKDWEMNNEVIGNATRMDILEANMKADTSEGLKPLAVKSTSFSPPIVDEEVGQPKAIKAYKCQTCNISYVHRYTYVAHIRQVHMGIEHAFECDICHKVYTKFPNLYRHMRREHNQSLRQFKCEYPNCNRSFRQLPTRRKHYEEFHKHEPFPSKIDIVSKECLKQEETKHSNRSAFSTGPSSSTTSFSMPEVQTSSMSYQRNYFCTLCMDDFETSYDLKVHMNNNHKKELKYRCDICGTHKISQLKLDEHISTTHKNRSFACHICQKGLKTKSHLRQHILTVHNGVKPFPCEYCPTTFATKNTLKVHTRIHTGEKPFKCNVCERRFTQLTPMKKHLITHEKGHRNAIN